jgi:hypothetical protein
MTMCGFNGIGFFILNRCCYGVAWRAVVVTSGLPDHVGTSSAGSRRARIPTRRSSHSGTTRRRTMWWATGKSNGLAPTVMGHEAVNYTCCCKEV